MINVFWLSRCLFSTISGKCKSANSPEADSYGDIYRYRFFRLLSFWRPALVNRADLDRQRGLDKEGAELLRTAIAIEPNNAAIKHSLGLLLVRQRNLTEAFPLLREAAALDPDNARYAYVYAVALNSTGSITEAKAILGRTHKQHPADRNVLLGLIAFERDSGDLAAAMTHARELAALEPGNPQIRALVDELRRRLGR